MMISMTSRGGFRLRRVVQAFMIILKIFALKADKEMMLSMISRGKFKQIFVQSYTTKIHLNFAKLFSWDLNFLRCTPKLLDFKS